jgi:hypothetical protein
VLDVDLEQARYVREAFDRAERGDSIWSIAAWIQRLPVEVRGQRKMSYFNVRQLLKRSVYVARNVSGSNDVLERPRMRWSPLITDDQWRRVQARLAARAPEPKPERKYLLAGLIRCRKCGARMGGNRNQHFARTRGWKTQPRFVCMGRASGEGGSSVTCYESAVIPEVDNWVIETVSELIQHRRLEDRASSGSASTAQNPLTNVPSADCVVEPAVPASVRARLRRAALRLIDGQVSVAAYRRARDRMLTQASLEELQPSVALHLGPGAVGNGGWPEPGVIAEAWRTSAEDNDVPAMRRVLRELVVQVVPQRLSRGEYRAAIQWTKLAQDLFGATDESATSN